jgi:hypothetical protein
MLILNPRFLQEIGDFTILSPERTLTKETGFLLNLLATTKYVRQKTRFRAPCVSPIKNLDLFQIFYF